MNELARQILQFEAAHTTRRPTPTEIRNEFNLTATRYTQLLYKLIDTPEALKANPLLVHRLRRIRENTRRIP